MSLLSPLGLPPRAAPTTTRASRLLFELRAVDVVRAGALVARSGQTMAIGRASDGRFIDSNGNAGTARYSFPRIDMLDLDSDGSRETPTLLLERATTNRILRSNAINLSPWVDSNGITRVAAAYSAGNIVLDLLADVSSTAVASYAQPITYVGNGVKSFVVAVKKGSIPAAGGSSFVIRDNTSSVDMLNATLTWSGTAPVVTTSAGSYYSNRTQALANGIYLLHFVTASLTASHTNVLTVSPAKVDTQQGNLYVGNMQSDDAALSTSIIDTTTAAVTRASDIANATVNFQAQACTIYLKAVFASQDQGRADNLVMVGSDDITSTSQTGFGIYRDTSSGIKARSVVGGTFIDALISGSTIFATAPNVAHEILATYSLSAVTVAIDGGVPTITPATIPFWFPFSSNVLHLSGDNNIHILECKVAAGLLNLAQIRTA